MAKRNTGTIGSIDTRSSIPMSDEHQPHWNTATSTPYAAPTERPLRIAAFTATTGARHAAASSNRLSPETSAITSGNRVETRRIKIGLAQDALVEVREGLAAGEMIVARAGTFLRDGDTVRPVSAETAKVETQ